MEVDEISTGAYLEEEISELRIYGNGIITNINYSYDALAEAINSVPET